ncbi:glyoxalase [Frankia sp. CcI49]|uniref:VOC family protein n=1 Tax=Frankia sp. CcI49 TaxID=1745382 RepID=UPI0009772D4F|nr:VOC family protein [Frankia sp. CcI49]ONH59315.1 glyoxalase [Frankia sp. CcI49]
MAVSRRVFVSLDCAEGSEGLLARFWAAMLGGEVGFTGSTGAVGVRAEGLWIVAFPVPGYVAPTWPHAGVPKQIHLDLAVVDLEAAVAEAVRLGAVPAAVQPDPAGRWRVLFDPAGHPFCLTTLAPPE